MVYWKAIQEYGDSSRFGRKIMQGIVFPPSREEFQSYIVSKGFYPEAINLNMKAWDWCGHYHDDIIREDGSVYSDHPRSGAWILLQEIGIRNPEVTILELLHDLCEVKHMEPPTHELLCQEFGYVIAYKLKALTKVPGQDVGDYSRQVFRGGAKVVIAKFADRLHNLRTLSACDEEKQQRIRNDTAVYYFPFGGNFAEFFRDVSPRDREYITLLWSKMDEILGLGI